MPLKKHDNDNFRRFNINIVECKFLYAVQNGYPIKGFNINIVECKCV